MGEGAVAIVLKDERSAISDQPSGRYGGQVFRFSLLLRADG
jgi:hypothetical protein